jgi:hypothetical protein
MLNRLYSAGTLGPLSKYVRPTANMKNGSRIPARLDDSVIPVVKLDPYLAPAIQ